MTITEFLKKEIGKNKLVNDVIDILLSEGDDEAILSQMKHVCEYGCITGNVSQLIYYSDTIRWYEEHKNEINELLSDVCYGEGLPMWELFRNFDKQDMLVLDTNNQNLLAWFSFEEINNKLLDEFNCI
jgi:hypothetical protein